MTKAIDSQDFLNSIKSASIQSNKRKLQSAKIPYEVVVEDKYGKKYKYTNDKDLPEVIEEGMQRR